MSDAYLLAMRISGPLKARCDQRSGSSADYADYFGGAGTFIYCLMVSIISLAVGLSAAGPRHA